MISTTSGDTPVKCPKCGVEAFGRIMRGVTAFVPLCVGPEGVMRDDFRDIEILSDDIDETLHGCADCGHETNMGLDELDLWVTGAPLCTCLACLADDPEGAHGPGCKKGDR